MEKIICFSEKGDYINNSINIDKTNINIVKQLIVQFNDENFIKNFEELHEEYNKYTNLQVHIKVLLGMFPNSMKILAKDSV